MIKITPIGTKDQSPIFIKGTGWFTILRVSWAIFRTYSVVDVTERSNTKFNLAKTGIHILTVEDTE